jgi:membrane protein
MMKRRVLALGSLLQETWRQFGDDDGLWLAAAMAYYAAFSFFPLLLVLIAGLGLLLRISPGAQDAQSTLLAIVARSASPAMANELNQVLAGVKAQAGINGPLGLLGMLLGAIGILAALDSAFNRLWNIPMPKVNGILAMVRLVLSQRLKGFLMLLALGMLLVVASIGGFVLSAVGVWADTLPAARLSWQVAQIVLSTAINTLVFAAIYKFLPRTRVHWQDALAGAVLAALVWEIGKLLLAWVVIGQHYSAYGVVGAFIALMAWIFYASIIFFVSAEFVQVLGQKRAAAPQEKAMGQAGRSQLIKAEPRR